MSQEVRAIATLNYQTMDPNDSSALETAKAVEHLLSLGHESTQTQHQQSLTQLFPEERENLNLSYNKEDWIISNKPMMFLEDGTLVPCVSQNPPNCYYPVSWTLVEDKILLQFPKFKEFPAEIRRLIWKYALPAPRLRTFTVSVTSEKSCLFAASSDLKPWSLAYTCFESREVFLEKFALLRSKAADPNQTWDGLPRSVASTNITNNAVIDDIGYSDFKNDTIVIYSSDLDVLDGLGKALDTSKIEHLALGYDDKFKDLQTACAFGRQFPALKTLHLIYGRPFDYWDNEYEFYAEHLIDIDWRLDYMQTCDLAGKYDQYFSRPQRQRQMALYQHIAVQRKQEFSSLTDDDLGFWGDIAFSVSVIGALHEAWHYHNCKELFLVPKRPQYYNVSFYTYRPITPEERTDSKNWTWMTIEELSCEVFCGPDGKPFKDDDYEGISLMLGDD